MSAPTEPILAAEGLDLWLGPDRFHAVRGFDLEVREGEIVAIAGESGAGKTQAAAALIGLAGSNPEFSASGTVTFNGETIEASDLGRLARLRGRGISMVSQEAMASITPVRKIGDLLNETLDRVGGGSADGQAHDLLREVGFRDPDLILGSFAHQLSGGMRQRVAFALALASGPRVLIADEPTTALDLRLQAALMALIARLRRERGMSILLISHDLAVLAQLADRTLIMREGRLIESGPTADLFAEPRNPYTRRLLERSRARRSVHAFA